MTARFKLYYNSDGSVNQYSMEDLPGDHIEIDADTFHACRYDVKIVKNKIISLSQTVISKYYQTDTAAENTVATDPWDILLLVSTDEPHILWDYRSDN
jgi:hypothetical protein